MPRFRAALLAMMIVITITLIVIVNWASVRAADKMGEPTVRVPMAVSDWWRVASNPDLGRWTGKNSLTLRFGHQSRREDVLEIAIRQQGRLVRQRSTVSGPRTADRISNDFLGD